MFANRRFVSTLILVALLLFVLSPEAVLAVNLPSGASLSAPFTPGVSDRLMRLAHTLGSARVIVRLNLSYQPEAKLSGTQAVAAQRAAIQHMQDALLLRLNAQQGAAAKRFQFVPYLALSVDEAGLALLKTFPEVAAVEEDLPIPAALAESVPLIGATSAQTGGYTGKDQTVAILDTGVDKTHPFLSSKVVSEACYSSTDSSYSATTVCPDGSESSTAVGSAVNCSVEEGCNHGTHVAGIAAGKGASFSGVASDASIIAIQVFSRFNSSAYCTATPCILSFTSDEILGLERVYALRSNYSIAAVNMSLGSGIYSSYCDSTNSAIKTAIDNLRAAGIATVISSGNDGSTTGISAPACISSAVSVGSTRDGSAGATPVDSVSSFSNSASILSLLAPGQYIYSSIPGGQYATYQGTSMAAPHVTGAWAVYKSKYPTATVDQVLNALAGSGVPVTDTRNSITKPRIQVDAALGAESETPPTVSGFSPYSGPVGTIVDIFGTNLNGVTAVQFNTTAATSVEIVSLTHIRAAVPTGAVAGKIKIISPGGSASSVSSFQVGANPIAYPLVSTAIAGTKDGTEAWADYNNDARLDVLVTGTDAGTAVTRLYRGDGSGGFTLVNAGLPGSAHGGVAWGDVDNDGDLDLLLTGTGADNTGTHLYRNENGAFTEDPVGLPAAVYAAVKFGDYDLDGDLDLALSGLIGSTAQTRIYRNDGGGSFIQISVSSLIGVKRGSLNWVDYDNDGDPDLFSTGLSGTGVLSMMYRNDGGGAFAQTALNLDLFYDGSSDWGDFDNDGDMDVLLAGATSSSLLTKVYRNNGSGTFSQVTLSAPAASTGTAAWADYDNDGDLDILVSDSNGDIPIAAIYKNQSGAFSLAYVPIHGIRSGQAAWGDYDGDQDPDLLLVGDTLAGPQAFLYRNDALPANKAPTAPANLTYTDAGDVTLRWDPSSDTLTPAAGLTYNLRIGQTPSGSEILAPGSDPATGFRRLPAAGNVGQGTSAVIKGLPYGTYYWAVQAVDASLSASPFSAEQVFQILPKVFLKNASARVNEYMPFPQFEVVLEKSLDTTVTVDYSTQSETAVAGNDFMPAGGTLTFAPGQTSQSFPVEIINDTLADGDETFLINLSNPSSPLHLGSPQQERVTIVEDDGFVDSGIGLPGGTMEMSATWGDYDNDGWLDLALSGWASSKYVARIYHNNHGSFSDIIAGLPTADYTYFEWVDYDMDGELDLFYYGRPTSGSYFTRIYHNTAGVFTDINAGLPAYAWQHNTWADYDLDGDPDFLLVSSSGTFLYQNNSGRFSVVTSGLPALQTGPAAWGDYDKDGDPDLVLSGYVPNSYYTYITRIYRNDGNGVFTDINAGLKGTYGGAAAWGDYDNDGYLDLLVTGGPSSNCVTNIYHNNGDGTFTDIHAALPGAGNNTDTSSWGDFDNDGDLDILLVGIASSTNIETRVYRNDGGGVFTDIRSNIKGLNWTPTSWGDYDNDGDLDMILLDAGTNDNGGHIYENRSVRKNTPPDAPTNLRATVTGTSVTLRWDAARDDQTPTSALTYNLRVGTYPGGDNIISPMSNKSTGYRSVPQVGNANLRTFAMLNNLSKGMTYYWSIQAVDTAFAGSPFAAEGSFGVSIPAINLGGPVTVSEAQASATVAVQLTNSSVRTVTVQYATSDGTAATGSDYQAASGQLIFNAGETVKMITVPISEDALDEDDEIVHLTLSGQVNASLGASSTVDITIQDNDAAPTIQLAAGAYTVDEGDGSAVLTAELSAASGKTVTVSYSSTSGSAGSGSDYTPASGQLTFAPGEMRKNITVPVLNDTLDEPDETFLLDISAPANASLGAPSRSTVTIVDDDPAALVRFSSASYEIAENGGQAVVTVQLTKPSAWTVQAHYAATGNTAQAGSDFQTVEGDLSFTPGETSKTFSVAVIEDALKESDETIHLALSGLVNAAPGSPTAAQLIIRDNDPAPLLHFGAESYTAAETDNQVTITVTLSVPAGMPVTVDYATADMTGRTGLDYVATSGTLTFPTGSTSQSFTVSLIDNGLDNDDKTVSLALSNPSGAVLPGSPANAVLTIRDDDPAPVVQFTQPSVQVQEGSGPVTITVTLSATSEKTVTVSYHVVSGSATSGADYTGGEGQLTFAPGEITQTLTLTILEDDQEDPAEGFVLAIFDPTNAAIGQPFELELLIVDNDQQLFRRYLPVVLCGY